MAQDEIGPRRPFSIFARPKTTRALTQLRSRLTVRGKKLASPFGWYIHSAETPHPAPSGAFRGVSVAFLHLASYQEAPGPRQKRREKLLKALDEASRHY